MKTHAFKNILKHDFSRRHFMIGAAGLTLGFSSTVLLSANAAEHNGNQPDAAQGVEFSAWVTIANDGMISIRSPANEMGQGSKTSLPLILAEEMDADWGKVKIVNAPPNDAIYGNPGFLGMMYTAGSTSVAGYFSELRIFGAQVRRVLLDNVADHWSVPVGELTTKSNEVIHEKTGRRIGYGEISKFAVLPPSAPSVTAAELKKIGEFRLIGTDVMRSELPTKINGSARYSIDVEVPEMLYGAVLHPPMAGSEAEKVNDTKARGVTGVVGVFRLPVGVGVVATTPWSAFAAKDALEVNWSESAKARGFDSDKAIEEYASVARGAAPHKAALWDMVGAGADALRDADHIIVGEYRCDYAYHAQMEPLNAVASVSPNLDSVELWCGTQSQTMAVSVAAKTLGLSPDKVKFHEMLLGGGFGRRGPRDQDFIVGALLLSKEVKRPVKVIWQREDDIHYGRFRPMSAHHLQGGIDKSGALFAWHHRVATDNVGIFQDPVRYYGPWKERDMISIPGTDLPTYSIPNRLAEHFAMDSGIRVSALRGIGFTANKFATEAFVDEIARKQGIDPLAFHLGLLNGAPRGQTVVELVAEMADWRRKRDGRALGLAYIDYSGTQVAGIAEVSLDRKTGEIRVHNFWVAIDSGIAIQPDNIVAQIEGSVVYGMGVALTERVSIKDGAVEQSNFYDYTVMRMSDVPEIHVKVISTDNRPTGVGQMATPLVAPAISNAVAELTGIRLRHTPMLPERVLAALRA